MKKLIGLILAIFISLMIATSVLALNGRMIDFIKQRNEVAMGTPLDTGANLLEPVPEQPIMKIPWLEFELQEPRLEAPKNNVRLIATTSSNIEKQNFVQRGCKIVHELEEETAIECPKDVASEFKDITMEDTPFRITNIIEKISQEYKINDYFTDYYIGATKVWQDGYTGKGRVIAVLDTGADYGHQSLGNCSVSSYIYHGSRQYYTLESPHPYTDYYNHTWKIEVPGFSSIAIHFVNISTEYYFDRVIIKDSLGNTLAEYTGNYKDIWTPSAVGNDIYVNLVSDVSIMGYGFYIDEVINGNVEKSTSWTKCTKIIAGWDFVNNDSDPVDDNGHGTHVSGIISGKLIPDIFAAGVAPDAQIIVGKVCNRWGGCWESDILAGIEWAANGVKVNMTKECYEECGRSTSSSCCSKLPGCKIEVLPDSPKYNCTGIYYKVELVKPDAISMSLGGGSWLTTNCDKNLLAKKINGAVRNKKVPVVVAAGNKPYGVSSPACGSEAIAVGALGSYWYDPWEEEYYNWIAYFSGRGYAMEDHGVLAPGVMVYSTLPGNTYGWMSGTSMATPHVAGLIALMKQKNPRLTPNEIKKAICKAADDVPFGYYAIDDKNYEMGCGKINIERTLEKVR